MVTPTSKVKFPPCPTCGWRSEIRKRSYGWHCRHCGTKWGDTIGIQIPDGIKTLVVKQTPEPEKNPIEVPDGMVLVEGYRRNPNKVSRYLRKLPAKRSPIKA